MSKAQELISLCEGKMDKALDYLIELIDKGKEFPDAQEMAVNKYGVDPTKLMKAYDDFENESLSEEVKRGPLAKISIFKSVARNDEQITKLNGYDRVVKGQKPLGYFTSDGGGTINVVYPKTVLVIDYRTMDLLKQSVFVKS